MNYFACKNCNKTMAASSYDVDCVDCSIRYHIPVVGQPYKYTIFENDKFIKDINSKPNWNFGTYEVQITVGKTLFDMYKQTGIYNTNNYSIKYIHTNDDYTRYHIYSKVFMRPDFIRNEIISNLVFK